MKKLFSIISVVAIFMLPLFTLSAQNGAGGRYALVIGEGGYQYIKPALTNPLNDAEDMSAALRDLGFTVELLKDAGLRDINAAVSRLKENLAQSPADNYGFFYYAGHGLQSEGRNYLIPIEARISTAAELQRTALDVQNVYEELRAAGNALNVVVLDACRNNPLSRAISLTEDGRPAQGLAAVVYQPANSVIVYATAAGYIASDGSGRNGLFTSKLLANLKNVNLEVLEVFQETADAVQTESGNTQIPAIFSAFHKHAYFQKGKTVQTKPPVIAVEKRPAGLPVWVEKPLQYGKSVYEGGSTGVSDWTYVVANSRMATTKQRAKTEAQRRIQMDIAANIGSEFKGRFELTEKSLLRDSAVEDVDNLIENAVSISIDTRIPRFEALEWYYEEGVENGKAWYIAYGLVRFSRNEMTNIVNSIDANKVVDAIIAEAKRNKVVPQSATVSQSERILMVQQITEIRETVTEGTRKGLTRF